MRYIYVQANLANTCHSDFIITEVTLEGGWIRQRERQSIFSTTDFNAGNVRSRGFIYLVQRTRACYKHG
jgi:hypothetical protein